MRKKLSFKNIFNKKKLWSKYLLISTFLLIIVNDILLRILLGTNFLILKPFIANLLFLVLILVPVLFIPRIFQKTYFIFTWWFLTVITALNFLYYSYFSNFLSFSQLIQLKIISDVGSSVVDAFNPLVFFFLIMPILLTVIFKKNRHKINLTPLRGGVYSIAYVASTLLLLLLLNGAILTRTDISRVFKMWNRESVVSTVGVYTYQLSDFYKVVSTNFFSNASDFEKTQEDFDNFFSVKKAPEKNEYSNILEGKDVYYIHFESAQSFALDMLDESGSEITPNLNKLKNNSLYFSNFHSQVGYGTSSDTELNLSTGLYSLQMGSAFLNNAHNNYTSFEKLLKEKGYDIYAFHGNKGAFWNREEMYKSLGYDDFYSLEDFNYTEDVLLGASGLKGLNDEYFFKESVAEIARLKQSNNNPLFAKLITLSHHHPFTDSAALGNLNLEGMKEKAPSLERYLQSLNYADYALGIYLEEMEKAGLLDNAAIVLYGDHDAKLNASNYKYLEKQKGDDTLTTYDHKMYKKVPLMIYTKDGDLSKEITNVTGMIDVYAIMTNMLNIYNPYSFSVDTTVDESPIFFVNGSILTNDYYFDATESIWYYNGVVDDESNALELKSSLLELRDIELNLSSDIILNDYFAILLQ